MMAFIPKLRKKSRRFQRDEDGNSTIEFVILFPIFCAIMMGGYEIGYYTVSGSMLDRGLDLAVRDVRLGTNPDVTLTSLKSAICEYSRYVRNCEENIHVALQSVDASNFTLPSEIASCLDRSASVSPSTTFQDGNENELMIIRTCVNVDPIFPTTWLGAQMQSYPGSGYHLIATAAFVNEPNT